MRTALYKKHAPEFIKLIKQELNEDHKKIKELFQECGLDEHWNITTHSFYLSRDENAPASNIKWLKKERNGFYRILKTTKISKSLPERLRPLLADFSDKAANKFNIPSFEEWEGMRCKIFNVTFGYCGDWLIANAHVNITMPDEFIEITNKEYEELKKQVNNGES